MAAGRPRISVTLALEELREQTEDAEALRQAYQRAIAKRNNTIRNAREGSVTSRTLERITRLSRDSITRIVASPHDPLGDD